MDLSNFIQIVKHAVMFFPQTERGRLNGFAISKDWDSFGSMNLEQSSNSAKRGMFFSRKWYLGGKSQENLSLDFPLCGMVLDRFKQTDKGLIAVIDIGVLWYDENFTASNGSSQTEIENYYSAAFLLAALLEYIKNIEVRTVDGQTVYDNAQFFEWYAANNVDITVLKDDVAVAKHKKHRGVNVSDSFYMLPIEQQVYGVAVEVEVPVDSCLDYGTSVIFDFSKFDSYKLNIAGIGTLIP